MDVKADLQRIKRMLADAMVQARREADQHDMTRWASLPAANDEEHISYADDDPQQLLFASQ